MKRPAPAVVVAGAAVVSSAVAHTADSLLEAQALAGILVSAVLIDLIVARAGGELPTDTSFVKRLRLAVPFALPGIGLVLVVLGAALALGHGRIAGASFDPASLGLGLVRSLGVVARRQLPFVVLPLVLLGRGVDPRAIVIFGGLASAATALHGGYSVLSVFVHLAAGWLGAAAIVRSREFLAGLLAEAAVFFVAGTMFTSVIDVRMGVWALTPIERVSGPYAGVLAAGLCGAAGWVFYGPRGRSGG